MPFAPGFNLELLKAVDPEPRFATVRIKTGKGQQGKGHNYSAEILRDIARQVNEKRPSGYKGHQDADRVSWEWREPVTAWLGALFHEAEQALYVKGYVPPTAPELRSQLDMASAGADVVNSVSIFGTRKVEGEEVKSYDLWSIDWTPKGRAGMDAELVSVSGEQEEGEGDVDRDEVIRSLKTDEIPDHLQEHFRGEGREEVRNELEGSDKAIGEMRIILELDESDEPDKVVDAVQGLVGTRQAKELEDKVSTKVKADVTGELMQAAVIERVTGRLPVDASDEDIAGEIEEAKELPHIKVLQAQRIPAVVGGGGGGEENERKGTAWS